VLSRDAKEGVSLQHILHGFATAAALTRLQPDACDVLVGPGHGDEGERHQLPPGLPLHISHVHNNVANRVAGYLSPVGCQVGNASGSTSQAFHKHCCMTSHRQPRNS
jgi:hypothetical protein